MDTQAAAPAKRNRKQPFEFVRLVGAERRVGPTLASVSRHWKHAQESFLFVSPHDDDVVIGGSLMIQSALKEKVPVYVAVVTDGSMGYCSMEEKDTISEIRRHETFEAFRVLGVPKKNIFWLGFPDCQLTRYRGRRAATADDAAQSHGFTGMQNAFTDLLRRVRPNQIFMPTKADLHPDHVLVHEEMMISCFHAAGSIWPELGEPLTSIPYLHELAIYCNFPSPPKLRIHAPDWAMEKKLQAVGEFRSQKQIASMVESLNRSGPWEYLRPLEFSLYNPAVYREMFDEPTHLGPIR